MSLNVLNFYIFGKKGVTAFSSILEDVVTNQTMLRIDKRLKDM